MKHFTRKFKSLLLDKQFLIKSCFASEFFRLRGLFGAVQPVPQPAPPEAEAVRDVLRDRGEEEDILSRH